MSVTRSFRPTIQPHWPFLILLALFILFTTAQIGRVPEVWYDEGLNLNAARTLAETGLYGLTSDGNVRLVDPAIQTGTPMLVPLAALYNLFGANLAASRSLTAMCGMAALIALYLLVWRMYGVFPAFLTGLFLLLMPGNSTATFVMMSRQVLGEVPAILCITLGLHVILNKKHPWWASILTGICFGLAITLKSQILLVLVTTVGLWTAYNVARRGEWRFWMATMAVMLVVYGADSLWRSSMAGAQMAGNIDTLRDGIGIHILPFRTLSNLRQMSVWMALGLVAVTTGSTVVLSYAPDRAKSEPENVARVQNFLLLFVGLWVLWFALISIGWQRYGFVGIVFTLVLSSKAVNWVWHEALKWPVKPIIYAVGIGICAVSLGAMYIPRLANANGDFDALVRYLRTDIPQGARVASMEWPASYFTDQNFIYPPTSVINAITAAIFLKRPYDPGMFDPISGCPEYVLVGPFTNPAVMQSALEAAQSTALFAQGDYQLYAIAPERVVNVGDGRCGTAEAEDDMTRMRSRSSPTVSRIILT